MDGTKEQVVYSSNPIEGVGIFNLEERLPVSEPSLLVSVSGDLYSSLWSLYQLEEDRKGMMEGSR